MICQPPGCQQPARDGHQTAGFSPHVCGDVRGSLSEAGKLSRCEAVTMKLVPLTGNLLKTIADFFHVAFTLKSGKKTSTVSFLQIRGKRGTTFYFG